MEIPKNKLPRFGIVTSDFVPEAADLIDAISIQEEEVTDAKTSVDIRLANPTPIIASGTLTKQESEEVDRQIDAMIQDITATRNQIVSMKKRIAEDVQALSANAGGELGFEMDISKNPVLKEAARKLFGRRVKVLTYSMYLEMLNAKKQMELEDIAGYR